MFIVPAAEAIETLRQNTNDKTASCR